MKNWTERRKWKFVGVIVVALLGVAYLSVPIIESKVERTHKLILTEELERREIREGRRYYVPRESFRIGRRRNGWTIAFQFDSSDYYSPELLGDQWEDMSKVGGVSYFDWWNWSTWPFNRCSPLLGFRMDTVKYQVTIAPYVNDCEGGFDIGQLVNVKAGELALIDYDLFNGVAVYEIWTDSAYIQDVLPINEKRLEVTIPAYHGGTLPAPVDHGFFSKQKIK